MTVPTALAGGVTEFAIPAQPLASALRDFAQQTGLLMSYRAEWVEGLHSPGVRGSYEPLSALPLLLHGTNLAARLTPAGIVTLIQSSQPKAQPGPSSTVLAPVLVTAAAPRSPNQLDQNSGYSQKLSSIAGKIDAPILETPASVQVVTRRVMRDQQVIRMEDALRSVSGVDTGGGPYGWGSSFSIRGFHAFQYYRDGVPVPFDTFNDGYRDFANIDRVEVLKGPASVLYGRMEPGGMINLIPKQPEGVFRHALQQQIGSFDWHRTSLDTTGPLGTATSWEYRLNMAHESGGSFRELVENRRTFIAPVLTWTISGSTRASFYLEYLDSRDGQANELPLVGNRAPDVPPGRNLGEAGSYKALENLRGGLAINHQLSDAWSVRGRFDAYSGDTRDRLTTWISSVAGTTCTTARCVLNRALIDGTSDGRSQSALMEVMGVVPTGSLRHEVVVGVDFFHQHAALGGPRRPYAAFDLGALLPPIDLYRPVHSGLPDYSAARPDLAFWSRRDERWFGGYVHDQISLPGHVQVLAGVRYDDALPASELSLDIPDRSHFSQKARETALTPRLGLSWQPVDTVSLYGNYVEGFGSSNSFGLAAIESGGPLPPSRARQWEIGAKLESPDGRLRGTLAWFDITKTNIASASPDPARAALGYRGTVGEARNRGLELDVAGDLGRGLKLTGSYAHIDSEITRDLRASYDAQGRLAGYSPGNQGNSLYGVAGNGGSLWLTYQPTDVGLDGAIVGAGLFARAARWGDDANSFRLPGYALVNLMAGYTWSVKNARVSLQLNVNNLLDKVYWESSNYGARSVLGGPPRTFLGMIRVEL